MKKQPFDTDTLGQLFLNARSINVWREDPVSEDDLRKIYDLMKMGPTSANCSPARIVFVTSQEGKEKLRPLVMDGNVDKIMQAPVTAIIGYDMDFANRLNKLFPHDPTAPSWFSDPEVAFATAFRNSTLQGAYLMMAARSVGYDCGPMSGFDHDGVDNAFFKGTNIKSNFLCGIGVGSDERIFDRSPRLDFNDAVKLV